MYDKPISGISISTFSLHRSTALCRPEAVRLWSDDDETSTSPALVRVSYAHTKHPSHLRHIHAMAILPST